MQQLSQCITECHQWIVTWEILETLTNLFYTLYQNPKDINKKIVGIE